MTKCKSATESVEAASKKGWTQERLAAEAEISVQQLRALEKGQRNLGVDHLGRLSDAMGVSSDFLLKGCSLCHNSYLVVLSAATQRFGRRNWVLFAILPAIKMLSPFPHSRIMHADSNSTLFHKSEFAHKLPQSIFSVKSFFAAERDKFTQQTHKNEYLHSNYTYFTINSFQKHQYVLVCSATISNFLRFSQVSFSRFHAKN